MFNLVKKSCLSPVEIRFSLIDPQYPLLIAKGDWMGAVYRMRLQKPETLSQKVWHDA